MSNKIVYLGTWEKNYSRNKVVIEGLKKAGIKVEIFHIQTEWNKKTHKTNLSKLKIIRDIFRSYFLMIYYFFFKIKNYDYIFVGYPGWFDLPLVWLLNKLKKEKLVFDSYFSIYDSMVNDRKSVKKNSIQSRFFFFLDKICCNLTDLILLDTNEHIKYFIKTFNIKKKKFIRVFIGADDEIFYPRKKSKNKRFKVVFHGKFIPLQGVPYIIKAAKLLEKENIEFDIIGGGQLKKEIVKFSEKLNTNNVKFLGFINLKELPVYLSKADIGLGIFGDTEKAKRVIPNKAFEILAMKIPLITGDSPAAREVLINKKHCVLCKMADSKAIADSILLLKNESKLREKISINGYKLFKEKFSIQAIGKDMRKKLLK
jgi:glycosyltransferase involved in cell wall biosynthesis